MAEKEYIEREAVLMLCQDYIDSHEDGSWRWVNAVTDKDIMNIPSADVAPVRHGHWVKEKSDVLIHWHCSVCKNCYYLEEPNANYCPNCGAKMFGGEEND